MDNEVYTLIVAQEDKGSRLDAFVAKNLEDISRARVQKLLDEGWLTVDGAVKKANYRLNGGEEIKLEIPPAVSTEALPEDIPLDILYEDSDIIVINKARGMAVHPSPGIYSGTLVNALLYHCKDLSGIGGVERPGIVHRLDKDTSGVMVAAKNDNAHASLSKQIGEKTAARIYCAVVRGSINEEAGIIKGAIGRDEKDRQKMAVRADGKPAVTHFRVIERIGDYTVAECKLETGRTHQIRVHLAHIGYPVFGDPKYGSRKKTPFDGIIEGQALHSRQMTLVHPVTGQEMTFSAPLPKDMEDLIAAIRERAEQK
ncbi:MAG: RluA family pseudouridine synthase [Selenomonadaceae bacterium]|nr:RluA family pseudouridine synthase [Selenomonadaceae bacterium]